MKVREFLFDCGQLLYKRHKINPNRFGLYIDSPCWIKKTIINPINKKGKYFQYTVTAVLNHEETAKNPERITNIKSFINKYEQDGINFPSEKDDWTNLFCTLKKKKITPGYVSKFNSNQLNS